MTNPHVFALITGATDGIGKAAARQLAAAGYYVVVHGRDEARLRATVDELRRLPNAPQIDWVQADFAELAQVKALGVYLADNYDRFDVLINNVGAIEPERKSTVDGHERSFVVNYLAPVALTRALTPTLRATAAAHGEARVINVAANGHLKAALDFDDLRFANNYNGVTAYQRAKLAVVLWTKHLARELTDGGVSVNAVHPGVITTKTLFTGFGITGATPDEGAAPLVYLATSPELRGVTGRYFDMLRERKGVAAAKDEDAQTRLAAETNRLLG
jgi:NAD(P)-dependent dehydrogenase (short-subunit alcohol dehydrogenase family)